MTEVLVNDTQALAARLSTLTFRNAKEQDWQGKIEGQLPKWVHGTLFLNGPAAFSRGDLKREHWIDGDGLIRRLSFAAGNDVGNASFRSRYVQTQRYIEEQSGKNALCRSFGTAFPGDRLRRKLTLYSPANVSVHPFGRHLLAFGEQSLPWLLDPETLQTLEECHFGNNFNEIMPLSAHPKFDAQQRMCNFGAIFIGNSTRFQYHEWNTELESQVSGQANLKSSHLVHDCLITDEYACFYLNPYYLNNITFIRKRSSLLDAMHWEPDKTGEWLIFSRSTGKTLAQVNTEVPGFCLHTLNAQQLGDLLILDTLDTDTPYYDQYYANPGFISKVY